jgi:8-oxo-dGTP diphosphatase
MTTVNAERPAVGVGVVVIDQGRLLLIKRWGPFRTGYWAVPGGKPEWGETLADCAVREVAEETGLDVELGDVIWVGDAMSDEDPPEHHFVLIDFSARVIGGALEAGDDAKEAVFVDLSDVRSLLLTPSMYELLDDLGLEGAHR